MVPQTQLKIGHQSNEVKTNNEKGGFVFQKIVPVRKFDEITPFLKNCNKKTLVLLDFDLTIADILPIQMSDRYSRGKFLSSLKTLSNEEVEKAKIVSKAFSKIEYFLIDGEKTFKTIIELQSQFKTLFSQQDKLAKPRLFSRKHVYH